jgi:hypothetical protein
MTPYAANDTLADFASQESIFDTCHVPLSSHFGVRFGYARWLYHLRTGSSPGHAEIGREIGRTGPAVSGWMDAADAPIDWRVHTPLAEFLGIDESWLVRGQGDTPRPELWEAWLAARRQAQKADAGRFKPAPGSSSAAKKRGA